MSYHQPCASPHKTRAANPSTLVSHTTLTSCSKASLTKQLPQHFSAGSEKRLFWRLKTSWECSLCEPAGTPKHSPNAHRCIAQNRGSFSIVFSHWRYFLASRFITNEGRNPFNKHLTKKKKVPLNLCKLLMLTFDNSTKRLKQLEKETSWLFSSRYKILSWRVR